MLEANDHTAAKHEVEAIVRAKEQEGYKIPEEVASIAAQDWFAGVQAKVSNRDYYRLHAKAAEALLFNDLPWIDACLGETFVVPGRENKPKRKVFLKTGSIPAEVSIPESKVARMSLAAGDAVRIKGEFDEKQRFNLFVLERRPGATAWDVAPELLGVVNQVNEDKQVIRYIVSREINGEIPMSVLPCALPRAMPSRCSLFAMFRSVALNTACFPQRRAKKCQAICCARTSPRRFASLTAWDLPQAKYLFLRHWWSAARSKTVSRFPVRRYRSTTKA